MKYKKDIVIKKLVDGGRIRRNWALDKHITRLGAVIHNLKQKGWEFESHNINGNEDYVYIVKEQGDIPKRLRDIPSHLISSGRITL